MIVKNKAGQNEPMNEEIKKRTVVDRIKKGYIAACRASGVEVSAGVDIPLYEDDLPKGLGINFDELGTIILAIEKDQKYEDKIRLETFDDDGGGKSRHGQGYYRIHVSHGLFPRGPLANKKPKIFLVKGWWTISLNGKKEVSIAKQGTLAGELLGVLGESWGTTRKLDAVLDLLRERVTNKATEGRPTELQITNAMKEINRPLKKRNHPGIMLIRKSNSLGATWKFMLDIRSKESKVGFSDSKKPTTLKKNKMA